ncbi:sensor histidine kinase [Arcobacter roscoffensis]|uniref:histidine kinase n=1 Tax=Arcobacter roscoffensis TaxID=2961520 RepID=A0ABY5E5Y0_9BACT|nr:cache domain-containing protein [Arcobacter roscoffensis]UTJ06453.1 cache domain-containing protein [Arcobacter roscoffensis]
MLKRSIYKVLNVLTIFPPLLIILLSIIITTYIIYENQNKFEEESFELKKSYLKDSREKIYNEVNNVIKYIEYEYNNTEERLKKDLKNRVNEAYMVINGIIKNNPHLSKDEQVKLIKNALRDVRFNDGRGYYYIYSMQGECVLLPIQKSLEGSSFLDIKDKRGKYITRSIIDSLKDGKEEFMHWWWYKPGSSKTQYKKLSFNKYIKELDMYVGTGDYIDDFESVIKQKVLTYLSTFDYETGNYIFILNHEGNVLLHPNEDLKKSNINDLEHRDKYNLKSIIEIAKRGDGYITYSSDFLGLYKKNIYKTSYIKGLDKWNWVVGKGFYKNDLYETISFNQKKLEDENRELAFKIILISIIITTILVFTILYNVKYLKNKFDLISRKIEDEIKSNHEKDKLLFQQSKMASLGEMLQNIAHQWRQPLSVISTAASGLKLKHDYKILDENSINDTVAVIMKSTIYLSKTIDDFRNFYKNEKEEKNFNIKTAVQDSIDIISLKLKNKNIVLIFDSIDYEYKALKNELIQVIINIVNNAIDAFKKQNNKLILINITKDEELINISIKDNAGGIPNEIIDRVFEPYFTTKHQAQGTGIGLFMSEEIITKHFYGDIKVHNCNFEYKNEVYFGACFEIKLPIKKGQL